MKRSFLSVLFIPYLCFTVVANNPNGLQTLSVKTILLPGGIPLRFVKIQSGAFYMGSNLNEDGNTPDEAPKHLVTISKAFYIGQFEVTQSQWQAVMGNNPSVFRDSINSGNLPVEMVSWDDCQKFLEKLNSLVIGFFRLPTEAEWEYACRAGSQTRYSHGNDLDFSMLSDYAWFYSRAEGKSHTVGQKKPNAWNLYDMHGNVWEWCSDWYDSYSGESRIDPQGALAGDGKIIRGGSWFNEPQSLFCANRHRHPTDSRQTNIGLRLILVEK